MWIGFYYISNYCELLNRTKSKVLGAFPFIQMYQHELSLNKSHISAFKNHKMSYNFGYYTNNVDEISEVVCPKYLIQNYKIKQYIYKKAILKTAEKNLSVVLFCFIWLSNFHFVEKGHSKR